MELPPLELELKGNTTGGHFFISSIFIKHKFLTIGKKYIITIKEAETK